MILKKILESVKEYLDAFIFISVLIAFWSILIIVYKFGINNFSGWMMFPTIIAWFSTIGFICWSAIGLFKFLRKSNIWTLKHTDIPIVGQKLYYWTPNHEFMVSTITQVIIKADKYSTKIQISDSNNGIIFDGGDLSVLRNKGFYYDESEARQLLNDELLKKIS